VAIGSALLIALGFPVIDAITLTLIFNTTPVAFGALGVPITTLASVTNLPAGLLAAMVGRQLPIFGLILPFYAMVVFTGFRSLRTIWPVALVAGLSFALMQFTVSNFVGPELPDVLASLFSLVCVILFVQVWKPRDIDEYRASFTPTSQVATVIGGDSPISEQGVPIGGGETSTAENVDNGTGAKPTGSEAILAWLPWLLVSAVVIAWTFLKVPALGALSIHWPGLDKQVFLTLYNRPYTAVYAFQPLGTGTAILFTVILTAFIMMGAGSHGSIIWLALADTWRQLRLAILTVMLIIGMAYLYNYSGMSYTLGLAISKVGAIFPFFSVFLGWIACFLSGSDTSSNALFGNLQVVAARQLNLSPLLMAASNSSGAVMSKMISPQNVSTGVSTTGLAGKEGLIIRKTFFHSLILATILGIIVMLQQYVFPGIIPH